jgi:hypothetical protein
VAKALDVFDEFSFMGGLGGVVWGVGENPPPVGGEVSLLADIQIIPHFRKL